MIGLHPATAHSLDRYCYKREKLYEEFCHPGSGLSYSSTDQKMEDVIAYFGERKEFEIIYLHDNKQLII